MIDPWSPKSVSEVFLPHVAAPRATYQVSLAVILLATTSYAMLQSLVYAVLRTIQTRSRSARCSRSSHLDCVTIVARVIQGAAGTIRSLAFGIISDEFPRRHKGRVRRRYHGLLSVQAAGSASPRRPAVRFRHVLGFDTYSVSAFVSKFPQA